MEKPGRSIFLTSRLRLLVTQLKSITTACIRVYLRRHRAFFSRNIKALLSSTFMSFMRLSGVVAFGAISIYYAHVYGVITESRSIDSEVWVIEKKWKFVRLRRSRVAFFFLPILDQQQFIDIFRSPSLASTHTTTRFYYLFWRREKARLGVRKILVVLAQFERHETHIANHAPCVVVSGLRRIGKRGNMSGCAPLFHPALVCEGKASGTESI